MINKCKYKNYNFDNLTVYITYKDEINNIILHSYHCVHFFLEINNIIYFYIINKINIIDFELIKQSGFVDNFGNVELYDKETFDFNQCKDMFNFDPNPRHNKRSKKIKND